MRIRVREAVMVGDMEKGRSKGGQVLGERKVWGDLPFDIGD